MRDVSSRDVVLTVMAVAVALIGTVYLISLT
jgi:hypothetical protein